MKRSDRRKETVIILTGVILAIAVVAVCFVCFFKLDTYIAEAAERGRKRDFSLSKEMQDELAQNPSAAPTALPEPESGASADADSKTTGSPVKTVMPETQHDMTLTPTPDPQEYWATHPTPTPNPTATPDPKSPVAAWVNTSSGVNMYMYTNIPVASSSTTSVKEGSSSDYAFDGLKETSWTDGETGDGKMEILYAKLDRKQKVSCILFRMGNWSSYDAWYQNGRPTLMTVWLSENAYQVTFPDYMDEYCLEFSRPIETSELSFLIEGVSSGGSKDTYITDIQLYSEGE